MRAATIRASVVFPVPGGPKKIADRTRSSSIARRSAEPRRARAAGRRTRPAARPQAHGERRDVAHPLLRGVREEVTHEPKYAPRAVAVSRTAPLEERRTTSRRFSPGDGASDYERYLRTDELLALQKRPEERAHHDELLFQTVHQSSELWLKLAVDEVEEAATAHSSAASSRRALRLLRRRTHCLRYVTGSSTCSSTCRRGSTRLDPARARPRQRLRLARLPRAAPRGAAARARRSTRSCASAASTSSTLYVAGASTRSCTSSPRR